MLLRITDLHVYYGAIHAVRGVTLEVGPSEIVTLIGSNGAGKSTILRTISGLQRPRSGSITLNGTELTRMEPDAIVRAGVCQVPEGRHIFANLTVRENLELGGYTLARPSDRQEAMERVLERFPRLRERLKQYAGTLSGGEQQMLAIGRALMARPRVLLLDEPSLGLAPQLVHDIFAIIREINQQGTAVLLVEQNAHMALGIAGRGYVLETGRVALTDAAENLLNNPEVRRAYLGE
ncbi:MAG: ABC transporter ATP-binding protein [Armatimonadota bacterium]